MCNLLEQDLHRPKEVNLHSYIHVRKKLSSLFTFRTQNQNDLNKITLDTAVIFLLYLVNSHVYSYSFPPGIR